MSIYQFPNQLYIQPFTQGEDLRMGSFQLVESMELQYIRTQLHIYNQAITTQRVRIKIYGDQDYTDLLYTSSWADLSGANASNYWLGYIRVSFNRENLNKNITYYAAIEIGNYTFSSSSFIGPTFDFPWPVYDNGAPNFFNHPLTMQIFGYK